MPLPAPCCCRTTGKARCPSLLTCTITVRSSNPRLFCSRVRVCILAAGAGSACLTAAVPINQLSSLGHMQQIGYLQQTHGRLHLPDILADASVLPAYTMAAPTMLATYAMRRELLLVQALPCQLPGSYLLARPGSCTARTGSFTQQIERTDATTSATAVSVQKTTSTTQSTVASSQPSQGAHISGTPAKQPEIENHLRVSSCPHCDAPDILDYSTTNVMRYYTTLKDSSCHSFIPQHGMIDKRAAHRRRNKRIMPKQRHAFPNESPCS